ncbi:putative inorganic phosphate cotransporter [Schistocerca piceifrons]|uniref:putative inorganic phosphate cotransporter n=1 Tax=Schistocerca piceifrons TaxID=274613 RepID=UPI001F5E67B4|nr:putative inorganic phosphate cotransporter [Schistocerca piceifrons]
MDHVIPGKAPVVPLRAVIGVLGFLGIVFQYVLKVTLSVAIGGMVNHTTSGAVDTSTCPLPDGTSTGESITEEGEFDWGDKMQGYILSSYYYGYAATNILGGYAAARFSARWVYGLGLLIAGVFTILGPGVVIPAMHVLFAKWFPEHERQRLTGAVFSACVGSALCLLGVTLVDCDVTLIIVLFVLTMVCRCAVYGGSYMNHLYLFPHSYGGAAGLALTGANVSGIITPIVTGAFVSGRQTVQQWKYVFYLAMGISAVPYIFYLIFGSAEDQETPWMEKRKLKRKQQSEP